MHILVKTANFAGTKTQARESIGRTILHSGIVFHKINENLSIIRLSVKFYFGYSPFALPVGEVFRCKVTADGSNGKCRRAFRR